MRVGQNDIIWTFLMPITSIIMLRAQVLLPENDKGKETYKNVLSCYINFKQLGFSFYKAWSSFKANFRKETCNVDDEVNLIK